MNRTPHNLRTARGIITWAAAGAVIWSAWAAIYLAWGAK